MELTILLFFKSKREKTRQKKFLLFS